MIITGQTKEELNNLLDLYKNNQADMQFFDQTINIINQHYQLNIEKIITNKIPDIAVNCDTLELLINKDNIFNLLEIFVNQTITNKYEKYRISLFNRQFLVMILHEITHIEKLLITFGQIKSSDFIKRIHEKYKEFFLDKMTLQNKYRKLIYLKFAYYYYFERQANIDAISTIIELNSEDIIKKYYSKSLLEYYKLGYYKLESNLYSPVETTLRLMGKKVDLKESKNLPFSEILNIGLPMTNKQYSEFYELLNTKCKTINDYDQVIERIRKIK